MMRSLHQQCPPRWFLHGTSIIEIVVLTPASSWTMVVGTKADWNIKGEPDPGLNGRQLDLHRGRYDATILPSMERILGV